ncbi:MAG: GntR family transcriptional regulator [Pseudomonadota bacterium]
MAGLELASGSPADIDQKTLSGQIYGRLRNDVINGEFLPGSKLAIEQLRTVYEVGATPLREALQRLSAEGFVVVQGQRGFRVADVSLRELEELTELRILIEGQAIRDSLQRADEQWESDLVVAFHHLRKIEQLANPEPELWEARNNAFHLALISRCESQWLRRIYSLLYDQHRRYRVIARVEREDRDIHGEHEAIMDAALARDIDRLLQCHETHIRNTVSALRHILEPS